MNSDDKKKKMTEVLKRHPVTLAYLFGSAARGNRGPLSDVDIAVLFDKGKPGGAGSLRYFSDLSYDLEKTLQAAVDLIDLGAVKSPLLKHRAVIRGELLISKDHKLRRELELAILHEYEDTRHLRWIQARIMRRQLSGKIL